MFLSWFGRLVSFKSNSSRRGRRPASTRGRPCCRLSLEQLESRCVPATVQFELASETVNDVSYAVTVLRRFIHTAADRAELGGGPVALKPQVVVGGTAKASVPSRRTR